MQDILKRFESALAEQDLIAVRMSVEELLKNYVTRNTSSELRSKICELLKRRAAEATNSALTSYLRSVAACMEQFPAPVGKQRPASQANPAMNRLGEFLNSQRK